MQGDGTAAQLDAYLKGEDYGKVGFGRIVVSEREAPILLANLGGKWASSSTERQRGPSCCRLFGPLSTITKGY